MNAECEATGLGLHFVCTLGAMMTEYVYYIDLYVLFTIWLPLVTFYCYILLHCKILLTGGPPISFRPP